MNNHKNSKELPADKLREYAKWLAGYLTRILKSTKDEWRTDEVLAFLGISHPAFELNYSKIGEVAIKKRSQGRINDNALVKCLKSTFIPWQRRWMVVGSTSIWYYSNYGDHSYMIRDNIQVDSTSMMNWTSISNKGVEFTLNFSRRKMSMASYNLIDGLNAINYIIQMFKINEYCRLHLYESFSPKRKDNKVQFFSDGESYFEKVFDILRLAEHEIFICGWMISPEMPLKRPFNRDLSENPRILDNRSDGFCDDKFAKENQELEQDSRLLRVLLSVAKRGVNVYIIVYKEFSLKMFNDSEHATKILTNLHPRIKMLRHPDNIFSLWSHHEKAIVVDRSIAMVGGLDLTWGRWDTCDHPLFDKGTPETGSYFPGVDYYNPMKKDIVKGRLFDKTLLKSKDTVPRMPWHDVAAMLSGSSVKDLVTHFIAYWNHAKEFCNESEALFSVMVVKDDHGLMVDQVNGMTEEGEEIANVFAALDLQKFIQNYNATNDWNDDINNPSDVLCLLLRNSRSFTAALSRLQ